MKMDVRPYLSLGERLIPFCYKKIRSRAACAVRSKTKPSYKTSAPGEIGLVLGESSLFRNRHEANNTHYHPEASRTVSQFNRRVLAAYYSSLLGAFAFE